MAYSKTQKEKIFEEVFRRVSEGEALRNVLRSENMPSNETFYKWLEADSEKAKRYAYACEERADAIFEECLSIADDSNSDLMISKGGEMVANNEVIQRSKLMVDTRKWMLGKLNPKKYSDKTAIDLTTDGESLKQKIDLSQLPQETLDKLIDDYDNKRLKGGEL